MYYARHPRKPFGEPFVGWGMSLGEVAGGGRWWMSLVDVAGGCRWGMSLVDVAGGCRWWMSLVDVAGGRRWDPKRARGDLGWWSWGRHKHSVDNSFPPAALGGDPRRPLGVAVATVGWVRLPGGGTPPRTQAPQTAAVQGGGFPPGSWWPATFHNNNDNNDKHDEVALR